jgi:hypothetical protein
MHSPLVLLSGACLVSLGFSSAAKDKSLGILFTCRLLCEHFVASIPLFHLLFILFLVNLLQHLFIGFLFLVGFVGPHDRSLLACSSTCRLNDRVKFMYSLLFCSVRFLEAIIYKIVRNHEALNNSSYMLRRT